MATRFVCLLLCALLAACGGQPAQDQPTAGTTSAGANAAPTEPAATVRLYTSVTQETVDAVVAGFSEEQPNTEVEVFRAPTGELSARIAAEQRGGEIGADILWLTDPLSMQQYDADGLLAAVPAQAQDAVPAEYRSDRFLGPRVLNMVIVARDDVDPPPAAWDDLASPDYADAVAIPDPSFAGSAFGALGYFAQDDRYGLDFYRRLADNGAVQVSAPDDVITGVAEGRFAAGMTLDNSARTAKEQGSPIEVIAPEPGAIAIYSPIAVLDAAAAPEAAGAFTEYVVSQAGQQAIADTGWEPVRDDVDWEHEVPQVTPDWKAVYDQQEQLLEEYRAIFGG